MERLDYDDFEVVLEGHADGMTAQVATSPVGPSGRVPFVLPGVDDQSLRILVLTLRATRSTRALDNEVTSDVRRYGEALFTALFHDESLTTLRSSLQVSSSKGHGLRIRIRYADMPALANVPWELLYDKQRRRFLCQYPKYPVVRFIDVPEDVRPLSIRGAVRMLVVISSPTELVDLDVEEEWRRLSAAVQPLIDSGQLIMDRLLVATLDAVRQAVTATDYHVFHFIGHGGFDAHTGDGTLAFTDKYGRYRPETGHDLGVILATSPIRLAVLNSCEGARVSDLDPYAGTAASLVDLGIPAVVAMQFEISDEAAIAFSAAMYTALMSGHTIDLEVTLARQAILTTSRSEWATPVLYLRAPEGVLFDFGREAIPLEELTHVLPAVVADAEEASGADLDVPHGAAGRRDNGGGERTAFRAAAHVLGEVAKTAPGRDPRGAHRGRHRLGGGREPVRRQCRPDERLADGCPDAHADADAEPGAVAVAAERVVAAATADVGSARPPRNDEAFRPATAQARHRGETDEPDPLPRRHDPERRLHRGQRRKGAGSHLDPHHHGELFRRSEESPEGVHHGRTDHELRVEDPGEPRLGPVHAGGRQPLAG